MRGPTIDVIIHHSQEPLVGTVKVPGDKSLSHRALIIAAMGTGISYFTGLNSGADVAATLNVLHAMGIFYEYTGESALHIQGHGLQGLQQPVQPLDLGNSGTSVRLLAGLVAGQPLTVTLSGDASLMRRPMRRVVDPLIQMGAQITTSATGTLPLTIQGTSGLQALSYRLPVASAQVKSAVLLAGLAASVQVTLEEPMVSRDHTERLLQFIGVPLTLEERGSQGRWIQLAPQSKVPAFSLVIPGDPSAAAFWVAAAVLVPQSRIRIESVLWNPLRNAFFMLLQQMGARIQVQPIAIKSCEDVVTLFTEFSQLQAIEVPAIFAPRLIDEYPILAVIAACAKGTSIFRGLAELRHKESDRLEAIAMGLQACGVTAIIDGDDLVIIGRPQIPGGAVIDCQHDHRMAMAFAILGLVTQKPLTLHGAQTIASSDPTFLKRLQS